MRFDVVIIGGGKSGTRAALKLAQAGKRCAVVSAGHCLGQTFRSEFIACGGTFLSGDRVIGGRIEEDRLLFVNTENLGKDTALEAENFILCTGKFFSKGLISTIDKIYEPVFGCEVVYEKDRSKWTASDFYASQPFESFGVRTTGLGQVYVDGKAVSNLYAAGEILAGEIDIEESVERVCRNII